MSEIPLGEAASSAVSAVKYYPPPNYCQVNDYLWRSSFPSGKYCMPFLRQFIAPQHIVVLYYWPAEEFSKQSSSFDYYITDIENMVGDLDSSSGNLSDFTVNNTAHQERHEENGKKVMEILKFLEECKSKKEKVLLVCSSGKHLTSLVIGCYRKAYDKWALSSVFEEMRRFRGVGSAQLPLEQMVEMWEC